MTNRYHLSISFLITLLTVGCTEVSLINSSKLNSLSSEGGASNSQDSASSKTSTKEVSGTHIVAGGGVATGTGIKAVLVVGKPFSGGNQAGAVLKSGSVQLMPNLPGSLKAN